MADEIPVSQPAEAPSGRNEFQGDLGLPAGQDTSDLATESPTEGSPDQPKDSSTGQQSQQPSSQPALAGASQEGLAAQEASKFRFYGRDWDTPDAAEQHFRSMEGRVRAQGQEVAESQNLVKRWNEWYEWQESEKAKATEATTKPSPKEPYLESVNWDTVNAVAQRDGLVAGIKAAFLQLGDHLDSEVLSKVRDEIAEVARPYQEYQQLQQADNHVKSWFMSAVNHVDADGNATFPELYEHGDKFQKDLALEAVQLWGRLVRAYPGFGMSRDGMDMAIYKAKDIMARRAPAPAQQVNGQMVSQVAQLSRDSQGRFIKQSEAIATDEAEGGTGATPASTGNVASQTAVEAEERRAIREAGRATPQARFFGVA